MRANSKHESGLLKRVKGVIATSSLVPEKLPLIVAVSGGPDSVCLLHILSSLFPDIKRIAVYIDHGLRPSETDAEKELIRRQAEQCSARFHCVAVDVRREKEQTKSSLEAAAHTLRYQALEEVRSSYDAGAVAVGHNGDDQAEEILLRLIRGSGRAGLSGMNLKQGTIIRPLLHETKESLITYLKERNIPFCLDSSNKDLRFLRNRIRMKLLPTLEKSYNPSIRNTLLQTASILGEEELLLIELTEQHYHNSVRESSTRCRLDLISFSATPRAIRRRIMEKICWQMGSTPSFQKIESLLQLSTSQSGSELHLAKGLRAIRQGEEIFFHYPSPQKGYRGPAAPRTSFSPLTIPGPGVYPVPELGYELTLTEEKSTVKPPHKRGALLLDGDHLTFPLLLRAHRPGERFHPLGAPGRKKISRFLSDQKIPPMERSYFPVLLFHDTVIAVAGLRIDQAFQVTDQTVKVLQLQWKVVNKA